MSSKYKWLGIILAVLFAIVVFIKLISSMKPYQEHDRAIWKIECELGIVIDPDCPIHGGWSSWGSWSVCHGFCDDVGHKQRVRTCTNPCPSNDGIFCSGPSVQKDICYLTNCHIEDYRKLFSGDAVRSEALRQLESVPALLERCLQIECHFESIGAALHAENTWKFDAESLWNLLQCVKHNMGCSLAGAWSAWGSWSACSARCGRGSQWKLRNCDTPPPSASYLMCDGDPFEEKPCDGDHCAFVEHENGTLAEGTWSTWGEWSTCSVECGTGVRRKKRVCLEQHKPHTGDVWGTHCRGPHDQLEKCVNKECSLDGGWIGWGPWGRCTRSCGIGKRSRVRSCTRPFPSGGGKMCSGSRTEVISCYLTPCVAYTHIVAVFNGEGFLQYKIPNKHSTMLHIYMRFKTFAQYGTLLYRGNTNSTYVRITIQRWHICIDVGGRTITCSLPRFCTLRVIAPEKWHIIMISVTTKAVYLSIDNFQPQVKENFACAPNFVDEEMNFRIGEKFHGEIQEVIINFKPLKISSERDVKTKKDITPFLASNVAYEKASIDEAFVSLSDGQYIRLNCFKNQEEWRLELKIRSSKKSGLIFHLKDDSSNNFLFCIMQNFRIKFKVILNDLRAESSSSTDYSTDEWLDIYVIKKKKTNTIEAVLNGNERLHIILAAKQMNKHYPHKKSCYVHKNNCSVIKQYESENIKQEIISFSICSDDILIGGLPTDYESLLDIDSFSGVIAFVAIDGVLQDLIKSDMERNTLNSVQVSSRTASISGSYQEIYWGKSKLLNLSCVNTQRMRAAHRSQWLQLDIGINNTMLEKKIKSVDNGRVLRLEASREDDLIGFYTCRVYGNNMIRNLITYGIIGNPQTFNVPNTVTAITVCTTLIILFVTLSWLLFEGISDLKNGYGFFRDQHLSPESEAEAICAFIDKNAHLIRSKKAINMSKYRARQIAKKVRQRYISKSSTSSETENNSEHLETVSDEFTFKTNDCQTLPVLLKKSDSFTPAYKVFRCEQSFVSSPRHGSPNSPDAKLSLASTFNSTSSRRSRLLTVKRKYSKLWHKCCRNVDTNRHYERLTMPTITSSGNLKVSIAQKVLQKFQELL